jgi:hypothetical protein
VPPILAVAGLSTAFEATTESVESPLSGVVASRTEPEIMTMPLSACCYSMFLPKPYRCLIQIKKLSDTLSGF